MDQGVVDGEYSVQRADGWLGPMDISAERRVLVQAGRSWVMVYLLGLSGLLRAPIVVQERLLSAMGEFGWLPASWKQQRTWVATESQGALNPLEQRSQTSLNSGMYQRIDPRSDSRNFRQRYTVAVLV